MHECKRTFETVEIITNNLFYYDDINNQMIQFEVHPEPKPKIVAELRIYLKNPTHHIINGDRFFEFEIQKLFNSPDTKFKEQTGDYVAYMVFNHFIKRYTEG